MSTILLVITLLFGAVQTNAEAVQAEVVEVTIEGNDALQFNLKEIKVKAGDTVKLTLKHVGKLPKAAMGHNWVLLNAGTELPAFAAKALAAKDNDYIPEGDEIIVHTSLIGGGEETTIEFEAPAAGTYDFLCTFPGHYALMQGKFIVE